ncbi:MAG TPA: TetR/AcrR family transcriptional regulator [Acidimicrobiales bacterium]|nr:TetR/AcrR family transcriptional regulator [Acidimicrobiales bacterium]
MGRPAKFSVDQILDTTAQLVAEGGPSRATVAGISDRMGAPTGSIYHRFESRDLLLARLWVRTAERAQQGFIDALQNSDLDAAALDAALHIPRWARDNLDEATVMLLYRREDLAERWPDELGDALDLLRSSVDDAVRSFVRRYFGRVSKSAMDATTFALLDVPYAAVRRHLLAGERPPALVDDLVATASTCVLRSRAARSTGASA